MAKFPTFYRGYDPTATTNVIQRAQLLQMIQEGEFVDFVGAKIYSESAPDVALYPKLAWFTWHKLLSGNPTGEEYYWDGVTWTPNTIKDGSLTGDAFADGSIGLNKLESPGIGNALKFIQVNVAGNGYQFSTVLDGISVNTIPYNKLVNAPTAGEVMYSTVGGVWTSIPFAGIFSSQLLTSELPVANITDIADQAAANDVICFTATGTSVALKQVVTLISNNTLATSKLVFAGLANKFLKVNATATDVTGVDTAFSVATIRGTAAQGVDGPKYTGAGPHIVPLDTKNDPNSIIKSLAANVFTLGVGVYELDLTVPIESANDSGGDTAMPMQIVLYKDTTVQDFVTFWTADDAQGNHAHYKGILTVTVEAPYKFFIDNPSTLGFYVGNAANITGRGEVYSQLVIRRL